MAANPAPTPHVRHPEGADQTGGSVSISQFAASVGDNRIRRVLLWIQEVRFIRRFSFGKLFFDRP